MSARDVVGIERRAGWVVATWHGEIDMANTRAIERYTLDAVQNVDTGLIVDVSALIYMDSAGIRSLISLRRLLEERRQTLRLVVAEQSMIRRALEIGGVTVAVPTYGSIDEATSA
jgi:anti-sigma B factor antagonist